MIYLSTFGIIDRLHPIIQGFYYGSFMIMFLGLFATSVLMITYEFKDYINGQSNVDNNNLCISLAGNITGTNMVGLAICPILRSNINIMLFILKIMIFNLVPISFV